MAQITCSSGNCTLNSEPEVFSGMTGSYFIPLYSRFDLISLSLNIVVFLVPIIKQFILWFGARLSFENCSAKWKPMHVTSCSISETTVNVSSTRKVRTVTLPSDSTEWDSLSQNIANKSQRPNKPASCTLGDRVYEIFTQSFFLLTLLVYLAQLFELILLCVTTTKISTLLLQETINSGLGLIVHFYHYGILYGPELWLSSVAVPEPLATPTRSMSFRNSINRRHRLCVLWLHCIAFTYFFIQSFCGFFKLLMIGLMWSNNFATFFTILRPYLLFFVVVLQGYFFVFHFITILSLSRQNKRCQDHVHKLSQVKYRRNRSTWLSMITFIWFIDILKLGNKKNLDFNDLGTLPPEELASAQHKRFYRAYKTVDIKQNFNTFLWRVGWKTYRESLIVAAFIKIVSDLASLIGPISIGFILTFISNYQESKQKYDRFFIQEELEYLQITEFFHNGFVLAFVVLFMTLLQSTLSNNFNHMVISEGIHLKTALNTCIYHKALRLPISEKSSSTMDLGSISNYMGADSTNIFQFFTMMHYLWSVPIKIMILLALLYQQMGISALLGASVFFILSPFQYFCSRKISQVQKLQMNISDERLSKTSELFLGIKLFKLLGWDLTFSEKIKQFRNQELKYLKKDAIYVAINTFITQGSAIVVTMITFTLYPIIEKRPLTPSTVFTSIALFNQITTPLYIVPLVIPMLVSAIISHRRLVTFFDSEEIKFDSIQWKNGNIRLQDIEPNSAPILFEPIFSTGKPVDRSKSSLAMSQNRSRCQSVLNDFSCYVLNGYFAYQHRTLDNDDAVLSNLTANIPRNKLTIVVGSMGCGKSTFLASLLGETYLLSGQLYWQDDNNRGFGYVPSEPWILNVSLQENITFGRGFERKLYNDVVKACCLQADIDILPAGDQTFIGERGINISGGQRQRIALARAIYSQTPTLILDDALSALDPIVGAAVFENAVIRLAIKQQKRTVILATHRQEFLSKADYVIVIESGTIKNQGTLPQIEKEDKAFFYQWNVIKQREIQERMDEKCKQQCKTSEERSKLVRFLSKKTSFRQLANNVKLSLSMSKSFGNRKAAMSRQMSYDTSNALPMHEWVDDDVFQEQNEDFNQSNQSKSFRRLYSIESGHSCNQDLYHSDENSSTSDDVSLDNYRISPVNTAVLQEYQVKECDENLPNSLETSESPEQSEITELMDARLSQKSFLPYVPHDPNRFAKRPQDEAFMDKMKKLFKAKPIDITSDKSLSQKSTRSSRGSDTSSLEDSTRDMDFELLNEMHTYNQNQIDTETLVNFDINPEKNHIPLEVYTAYFKAHSYKYASLVFGLIILNQSVRVISDYWLAKWTDNDEGVRLNKAASNLTSGPVIEPETEMSIYIQVYAFLSLISVIVSLITNLSAQLVALKAVRALHDNMLFTLVRCPLKLFDNTPIGRIMTRFSTDINVIDKKLPIAIPVLLRFFFLCLSAIVVNIVITPYFILAIIPVLILYYYIQKFFRTTSRQLQRLELSSKGPILSHFTQIVDGLSTIRAFSEQMLFIEKFFQLLDINNLCFLMVNSLNCCLGIWLDYLGGIILFLATIISIIAALYWNVHSAFVGLALTYTLLVPVYLNWLVRNISSVEMNMQSVERIYRFTKLPTEDSCLNRLQDSDKQFPEVWPTCGDIVFRNVSIQYEYNHQPILTNVNLKISHGEKIGICGRTGSGKSSLIGAMFRINQISSGTITIDGYDITKKCPNKLRKKLAIIPQELVLFSGTVRENLDPDNEHTDAEIWEVLNNFRLNRSIKTLDEEISDESSSLSSGAKQLLCCARAFLRKSPLLIMDESTSMLDSKSERLVLDQIFQSQRTVIAIAHRIMNIANFDKVIVVDSGQIAEFDTPCNLLNNPNSIFYSLYHKYSRST